MMIWMQNKTAQDVRRVVVLIFIGLGLSVNIGREIKKLNL